MASRQFYFTDLTIVMQGAVGAGTASRNALIENVMATRRAMPGVKVILSTWRGSDPQADWPVDLIVESHDPGQLPNFKYNSPRVMNNVNRQIVSSYAGLEAVKTRYALKMRADCCFTSAGFLEGLAQDSNTPSKSRIVVPHLFSVDPRVFEQMPFHFSDWFQFGETEKIQQLWRTPLMTHGDAIYYDSHVHAPWSSRFDRRYRARFAAEQHVWMHYAKDAGYLCPDFLNDVSDSILESHDQFVAREIEIVDVTRSGLLFPRYDWALRSGFQRFNCLTASDWSVLESSHSGRQIDSRTRITGMRRARVKPFLNALATRTEALAPALMSPLVKPLVSRFLKGVDAWSHQIAQ